MLIRSSNLYLSFTSWFLEPIFIYYCEILVRVLYFTVSHPSLKGSDYSSAEGQVQARAEKRQGQDCAIEGGSPYNFVIQEKEGRRHRQWRRGYVYNLLNSSLIFLFES